MSRFDCPVICAAFSACDNLLAVGTQDGTVKIIDVSNSSQARKFKAHDGQVKGIAFDPQRQYLATAGSDGHINIYDYTNADTRVGNVVAGAPVALTYELLQTILHPSNIVFRRSKCPKTYTDTFIPPT